MPAASRDEWQPNHRLRAAREQAFGSQSRARFGRAVKRRCQERFGGHCGVDHRKVRKWEDGVCHPDVCHQQAVCDVLGVAWEERERVGFAAPAREPTREVAAKLDLVEWYCPHCERLVRTAGWAIGVDQTRGRDTDRGQFLRAAGAGVVVLATDPLHGLTSIFPVPGLADAGSARVVADALSSTYETAKPAHLLGLARQHLSRVVDSLGAWAHSPGQLLAVGVDMACLCGWLSRSSGVVGDAHAYFALAADLAEVSAQPELLARALGSQSILRSSLYVPGGKSGNPREALELLEQALPGAEAGIFRAWLTIRTAEEHALLGARDACLRSLDLAQSELGRGDGSGFFSTQAFWSCGWNRYLALRRGRCFALLGQAELALAELRAADDEGSLRLVALSRADTALAWVVAGEPEPACEAMMRSLDVSEVSDYAVGGQRVREVRVRFDPQWKGLECVRAIDERLRGTTV
ncbi:MAG: hypothetical protein ACRDZO_10635 [Egibacteraceae bacterium]